MATSFAAYASQFLNKQNNGMSLSQTSSQPMFFSFTTDNGSHDGHVPDTDLDDLDDPHLRSSNVSKGEARNANHEEDDDPYLRLDEDEQIGRAGLDTRTLHPQSVPLIASESRSESPESPRGWLAHLASPMRHIRSPSPSPSSESGDSEPPPDLLVASPSHPQQPPPIPPSNRVPHSLSLTESLLPRDGRARPLDVFSLPDPRHIPRGRRRYNDSIWTVLWCTGVSLCVFFSVLLLFLIRKPVKLPRLTLPYTTLLHTVPLLTIITFLSAVVAYVHIYLLRVFVRPVMIATSLFVPVTLFISAIWAFVGSFMWDGDTVPTWGETIGLRLFSLIPLVLAIITARRLVRLPETLHIASSTLTLTTHLLISNPFLLALSPGILLLMLIASLPFLTLIFRLLLVGYSTHAFQGSPAWEWHLHTWANWAIGGAVVVWLWTWGVARGILRMTCSSVVGAWYFADPDAPPQPPTSTHTIHAAIIRSTGLSIGTIALSALLLTIIRILASLTMLLCRLSPYIPPRAFFIISGVRMVINYLETVTTALSKYALVYAGLTGDPFMHCARRAKALTASVEGKIGQYGRRKITSEPPLMLLTITPLTMTFPFALTTYLFVAHTLNAPEQALGAALLAAGVTALVGLFCVGLVKDTADTLYICYCIDKETGDRRRDEVFILFEYNQPPRPSNRSVEQQRVILQPPRQASRPTNTRNKQSPMPIPSPYPLDDIESRRTPIAVPTVPSISSSQRTQRPMPLSPSAAVVSKPVKSPPIAPPPLHSSAREDSEGEGGDIDPFKRSYQRSESPHRTLAATASRVSQEQHRDAEERMLTSRELNMKSIFLNPDRKYPLEDSDSEEEEGNESQLLPGSGFL
ncbi:hypothetical protein AX17_002052 [Amanita inopinata Kibby_2008]|nr:hypothetical protein AX17_002052 [Amanita inopinata Kibby_2008]